MKKAKQTYISTLLSILVLVFSYGCNSNGEEIEQPEKIYYDQAQRRMSSNNYLGAIES